MENNIIILGGGITGLTAGYLLNAPVITSEVGGQNSEKFPLGPRYVHATKETKTFVKSLGLNSEERTVKVGYYYNHDYHTTISPEYVFEYNLKTRGAVSSKSSIGMGSFNALKTSFSELIKVLEPKVEIVKDMIFKISGNTLFGVNGTYTFKKLISTIPLPELCELYEMKVGFNYVSIGYLFSDFDESFFFTETFGDFDYVYFPERMYPYYRVTKVDKGFVYEFASPDKMRCLFSQNCVWQKYGKILDNRIPDFPKNIILLGRYGEFNDDIMYHDVLSKLLLKTLEVNVDD